MSAKVSTFGRGVTFTSSGETGTQSNEFEAAIKSVTSSITVGAVFLYDTRNDSDSGAWRKKARGSWYYETLNTATRGGRREFPSVALIVADDSGVTIYDADDPSIPAWMVFNVVGETSATNSITAAGGQAFANLDSIFALNGRIYLGGNGAYNSQSLLEWNFVDDYFSNRGEAEVWSGRAGTISQRNTQQPLDKSFNAISNAAVNDVAATVLEGAEIGALGLPIPTVAVACNSPGASVIHSNGDVYDFTVGSYNSNAVAWDKDGLLIQFVNGTQRRVDRVPFGSLYTDTTVSASTVIYNLTNSGWSASDGMALGLSQDSLITAGEKTVAQGGASGLQIVKRQTGNDSGTGENLAAHITSTYNSGMMLGDIRLAALAGSGNAGQDVADRSAKANALTKSGSITSTAVATSAELHAYSGFSASNYFSRAYDADFDFGTGDFSIMFWVKFDENSVYDSLISREYHTGSAYSGNGFQIETGLNNSIILKDSSGTSLSAITGDSVFGQWRKIIFTRLGSKLYAYRDGVLIDGPDANTTDFDNSNATLEIGKRVGSNAAQADKSSLSLVRISATAPTPSQVKEIYEAEKPLFRAGAKCLLGGADAVEDLSYDSSTDLLTTAGNQNNIFRGLERVDTFNGQTHSDWNSTSSHVVASNGGVSSYVRAYGTGGVIVDLPAVDVRGDINTADTKLPDDGKFHFSGVTTDTTATNIGIIPIAENERYTVRAKIIGQQYNDQDGEWIKVNIEREFYRDIGANFGVQSVNYKLSDSSTASMYATTTLTGDSNNILVQVTGKCSTRMQWSAEVEVQRIADKQYER